MGTQPPDTIGAHRENRLSDRDILDDHSLQQDRLRGSLSRGRDWRRRPDPGLGRRLVASVLLGALAVGVMAVVGFMQKQLELKKKQERQQQQQLKPTPTSKPPAKKPAPRRQHVSPTSTHGVIPSPTREGARPTG